MAFSCCWTTGCGRRWSAKLCSALWPSCVISIPLGTTILRDVSARLAISSVSFYSNSPIANLRIRNGYTTFTYAANGCKGEVHYSEARLSRQQFFEGGHRTAFGIPLFEIALTGHQVAVGRSCFWPYRRGGYPPVSSESDIGSFLFGAPKEPLVWSIMRKRGLCGPAILRGVSWLQYWKRIRSCGVATKSYVWWGREAWAPSTGPTICVWTDGFARSKRFYPIC